MPDASPSPVSPRWRRWTGRAWRVVRLPLAVYVGLLVAMACLENRLVFPATKHPHEFAEPAGFPCVDVWVTSADGTRINGWYIPHEDPRAVVLYCHGNAGHLAHREMLLRRLHNELGVSVLIFDYRGYGRSEGSPNEKGVLADARAARAWLADREGIDQKEIVLMGRSLGGGVAVDLAAADGARGLILESTFTSLPDVGASYYPWLPVRWIMRNRFDSLSKIAGYSGPLLQSHGEADRMVPYELGCRLFEAANEPKQFIRFPDRLHNDGQPPSYYAELDAWLDGLD